MNNKQGIKVRGEVMGVLGDHVPYGMERALKIGIGGKAKGGKASKLLGGGRREGEMTFVQEMISQQRVATGTDPGGECSLEILKHEH